MDQAKEYYKAVYFALTAFGRMSVFVDTDNNYRIATCNVYGGHVQLVATPELDAYLPDGNLDEMDCEDFVAMCVECYGDDVPVFQ